MVQLPMSLSNFECYFRCSYVSEPNSLENMALVSFNLFACKSKRVRVRDFNCHIENEKITQRYRQSNVVIYWCTITRCLGLPQTTYIWSDVWPTESRHFRWSWCEFRSHAPITCLLQEHELNSHGGHS